MKPQWPTPSPLTAALCEPFRSCTPNCPPAPLAPAPSALLDPRTRSKNVRGGLAVAGFQWKSVELKITSLLNLAFEAQARQSVTKELNFFRVISLFFMCCHEFSSSNDGEFQEEETVSLSQRDFGHLRWLHPQSGPVFNLWQGEVHCTLCSARGGYIATHKAQNISIQGCLVFLCNFITHSFLYLEWNAFFLDCSRVQTHYN